jgi:hypothetical protein
MLSELIYHAPETEAIVNDRKATKHFDDVQGVVLHDIHVHASLPVPPNAFGMLTGI